MGMKERERVTKTSTITWHVRPTLKFRSYDDVIKYRLDIMLFVVSALFALQAQSVNGYWWYLGLSSSNLQATANSPQLHYRSKCTEIDVLDTRQVELCLRAKGVLEVVARGAAMGIEECQHQFRNRRWNCSTFNTTNVFGAVLEKRSRERAYVFSISSAAVMNAVTRACAKGEIQICSCDVTVKSGYGRDSQVQLTQRNADLSLEMIGHGQQSNALRTRSGEQTAGTRDGIKMEARTGGKEGGKRDGDGEGMENDGTFMWGGCSHDVKFGDKFSREFVDDLEDRQNADGLMNSWNNEAGRRAVSSTMQLVCKCHGVSGSCSSRICWRTMAPFRDVGDVLKDKFDGASRVKVVEVATPRMKRRGNDLVDGLKVAAVESERRSRHPRSRLTNKEHPDTGMALRKTRRQDGGGGVGETEQKSGEGGAEAVEGALAEIVQTGDNSQRQRVTPTIADPERNYNGAFNNERYGYGSSPALSWKPREVDPPVPSRPRSTQSGAHGFYGSLRTLPVRLRPVDRRQKRPTRGDLVYIDQSPDFCERNEREGSLGTEGRLCNRTSYGLDGCQLMCCGRGYSTLVENEEEDCNCKFHWCCRVDCEKCVTRVERHYCN